MPRSGGVRPNFIDHAFAIRNYKLGEADLIVVLLTQEHGLVRVVAPGARKSTSRLAAHIDKFSRISVRVYPKRKTGNTANSLGKLTEATLQDNYAAHIVNDSERYFAAAATLELAEITAQEPAVAGTVFANVEQTMQELASQHLTLPPRAIADSFALRMLELSGVAPSLVDCAQCGKPGPHRAFHSAAGGAVCVTCRPPGSATPDPQAVRLLWLLAHHRNDAARALLTGEGAAHLGATAHGLLLAHVRQHLQASVPAFAQL